jgi:hypothetical protein
MVARAEHGQPEAPALDGGGRACRLAIRSRPDAGDPDRTQMLERLEQRLDAEVERVVVGERDAVDAETHEQLDG